MGVLFKFWEVRIVVVSLENTFVILLIPEVRALLWGFSSRQDRVCHIRNVFVVPLIPEVRALLWGFSSHREHVHHVGCHPGRSRGSCPPMGVLFEFWEVQVVVTVECVCRIVHHPTCSVGFCPPVGVLFEFREVRVVIVLSGTHLSCRSSSHSFRFVIWPSLFVSNA